MSALPEHVEQLAAIEEIQQLKARYFRLLDTKQWDEWGAVFTTDVVMELPEVDTVVHGREDVVSGVGTALEGASTVHHGHMPEIEITGPDTARGTWAMFDHVEWPSGEEGIRNGFTGAGHYHEEYVREDGDWRIARLRLERLRIDPLA